jgi:hypothetical protein
MVHLVSASRVSCSLNMKPGHKASKPLQLENSAKMSCPLNVEQISLVMVCLALEDADASIDANATLKRHYTHIWCSKNLIFSDFSWFGGMLIKMWKFSSSDVRWGRHMKVYLEAPGASIDANCIFCTFFTLPDGIFWCGFHWLVAHSYGSKLVYQP